MHTSNINSVGRARKRSRVPGALCVLDFIRICFMRCPLRKLAMNLVQIFSVRLHIGKADAPCNMERLYPCQYGASSDQRVHHTSSNSESSKVVNGREFSTFAVGVFVSGFMGDAPVVVAVGSKGATAQLTPPSAGIIPPDRPRSTRPRFLLSTTTIYSLKMSILRPFQATDMFKFNNV